MSNVNTDNLKRLILNTIENRQPTRITHGTVTSINPLKIKLNNDLELTEELITLTWTDKLTSAFLNKTVTLLRQDGGGHYYVLYANYGGSGSASNPTGNVGTVHSGNRWLTDSEMEDNARYIWNYLKGKGWTEQAIAGVLGNLQHESKFNPGMWENGEVVPIDTPNRGFGICQWTPARNLHRFAELKGLDVNKMDTQLECLHNDMLPGTTGQYFLHPRYPQFAEVNTGEKFMKSTRSPRWLAEAFLVNFLRPAVFNQPKRWEWAQNWYDKLQGTSNVSTDSRVDKIVEWFMARLGKVTYSMEARMGPYSYDCSSAVFNALIYAGVVPRGTWPGTTETLFGMAGTKLRQISRAEVRKGDIFVAGVPGQSLYAAGHTGVAINNNQIIHCTYPRNGIAITPIAGWTGSPVRWYRII